MNTGTDTLARHKQAELLDALQMSRVVNLVGPRQVGETTLVRDLYGGGEFLTLDDEAILSAIETDTHIVGIEVKAAATVREEDFRHLKWFASNGPGRTRTITGFVFYLGDQSLPFGDRCFALPVSSLWAD